MLQERQRSSNIFPLSVWLFSLNKPKQFPGWRMVLVAFSVDFFAVGFFFYSYGAFFNAIAKDFEIGAFGASLVFTCVHGVGAICAPLVGRALDSYPVRLVMAIGAMSMGTGFLLLSQVNNVYQLYLVISLFIGFGASSMGNLATSKLVTNWFISRRGMALGLAASGVSLSGLIMPNVSAQLIENYGWQTGFALFGFFTLFVVLPLILRLVITRPEDVGFLPDGEPQDLDNTQQAQQERAIGFREVLRLPNFWIIVVTFALLFCSMSATLTHMIPRLEYLGYGLVFSAAIASVCAGAGFPGKLFFGWISDKVSIKLCMICVIAAQFFGQLFMYLSETTEMFVLGAIIFGFGVGGVVPMQGAIVGRTFGRSSFGSVLGIMRPAMFPIQILGVPFAGLVFDEFGSYEIAFRVFLLLYLLAIVSICFYKLPVERRLESYLRAK